VPRLGQSSVQSDLADRNFQFYVRRGTFGDINRGNDIEIPSDVRISTGDPNGAIYLTDPVTLAAGDSQAFFSARSLAPGSVSNAPAGVFTRHNFHRLHGRPVRNPAGDQPLRPGGGKRCRVRR